MSRHSPQAMRGYSLVELMVAMLFTMILMAGMASVFKSSLTSFYTAGEKLSSARRNRMAVDVLKDDLNSAGLYMATLGTTPVAASTNPFFQIIPNVSVPNSADPSDATGALIVADQLLFYMDQPLPFEGKLTYPALSTTPTSASQQVLAGVAQAASDNTYTIDCGSLPYAQMVAAGQTMIFRDWVDEVNIKSVTPPTDENVKVVLGPSDLASITGRGFTGTSTKVQHMSGTGIVFVSPAQMVRYSIQMVKLDPLNANGVPCLVRDQAPYDTAFPPAAGITSTTVITENVSGFKVYLSADSGKTWVGGSDPATGTAKANYSTWATIRGDLDTLLASKSGSKATGRNGFQTTEGNDNWFRSIPVLTRLDVTTRTATKRTDYSKAGPNTSAYATQVQSLIFLPRHFGLSLK